MTTPTEQAVHSHSNPEHDSLFTRFEQLDELLALAEVYGGGHATQARELVRLIRAQVLK